MPDREDSAPRTARQIARAELTKAITEAARRQLAAVGPSALSLRAVARELGMASSAVYRYVASRDELLTILIIDAYDAIGATAEAADAEALADGADTGARWLAVCRAVRAWALAHPNEWALVYGSPVPGYQAPQDTIGPASRLGLAMARIVIDAADAGALADVEPLPAPTLVDRGVLAAIGGLPDAPHEDLPERSMLLWIALVGTISFELFGHLHNVITDHDAGFDRQMAVAASSIGLTLRLDRGGRGRWRAGLCRGGLRLPGPLPERALGLSSGSGQAKGPDTS